MKTLRERFGGPAGAPEVDLVLPTPVEPLEQLGVMTGARLYVKRDDLTHAAYGGNKARKAAATIAAAREAGADALLTVGALGSNHVLATITHGVRAGFDVHALLLPQPWSDHVAHNLRVGVARGGVYHPLDRAALLPLAVAREKFRLKRAGKRAFFIPHGGSSPAGTLAYVDAALELAAQIAAGEAPEPDAIYVALGSGGTAVGLSIGLAMAGLETEVVAVRVTPRVVANRMVLHRLLDATLEGLRRRSDRVPPVAELARARLRIEHGAYAPGYGVPNGMTSRSTRLAAGDGLSLEATYTARALGQMIRDAESDPAKSRLYWHTLSSADTSRDLLRAPLPPHWAEAHAKR